MKTLDGGGWSAAPARSSRGSYPDRSSRPSSSTPRDGAGITRPFPRADPRLRGRARADGSDTSPRSTLALNSTVNCGDSALVHVNLIASTEKGLRDLHNNK